MKTSFSNLSQQKYDSCLVRARREVFSSIPGNQAKALPLGQDKESMHSFETQNSNELGTGDCSSEIPGFFVLSEKESVQESWLGAAKHQISKEL